MHTSRLAECKCVTVHPIRSELIAVGASDPYIRIYDRRMINPTSVQVFRVQRGPTHFFVNCDGVEWRGGTGV